MTGKKANLETNWLARLECEKPIKVKILEKAFADMPAGATMVVVTPRMVDGIVRTISFGECVDLRTIRKRLAADHGVEHACPVTTGLALRVVAEAAYEMILSGMKISCVAPFWRAVDPKSALAGKLACGVDFIVEKRNREVTSHQP